MNQIFNGENNYMDNMKWLTDTVDEDQIQNIHLDSTDKQVQPKYIVFDGKEIRTAFYNKALRKDDINIWELKTSGNELDITEFKQKKYDAISRAQVRAFQANQIQVQSKESLIDSLTKLYTKWGLDKNEAKNYLD